MVAFSFIFFAFCVVLYDGLEWTKYVNEAPTRIDFRIKT